MTDIDGETRNERDKLYIEIWKQAVDTQKHFNDMCVKSRQLGLTFVAASLGAALYLFIRSPGGGDGSSSASSASAYAFSFEVCGHIIIVHVALAIIAAAMAAVYAVKKLDLGVYHQMLRGAVTFNEDLETAHLLPIIGLQKGMTQSISHFSRHSDAKAEIEANGRYRYVGNNKRSAADKLSGFYRVILASLAAAAILIFVASNFLKAV